MSSFRRILPQLVPDIGLRACWGILALGVLSAPRSAAAHPLSQGSLALRVTPDRVAVRAKVSVEEVAVTLFFTTAGAEGAWEGADRFLYHARYLAEHLHLSADGQALRGRVVKVPTAGSAEAPLVGAAPLAEYVEYELEYTAGPALAAVPAVLELSHDVLTVLEAAPNMTWEASYVVGVEAEGLPSGAGQLLTSRKPIVFSLDPRHAGGLNPGSWVLAEQYLEHGVLHILGGYDHLLFVGALVLAALSLMDLIKVVTAFTVAHTLTLTLSALDVVRLPASIVEPLIAGSIVFVAAQNVLWPGHARGWWRLGAVFFFGLFHGLGFAGGLLEAMEGLSGGATLLAIAAFSAGVEVGHQLVVLPLYTVLRLAPRAVPHASWRELFPRRALRYGSVLIAAAGMYYLVGALGLGISLAAP